MGEENNSTRASCCATARVPIRLLAAGNPPLHEVHVFENMPGHLGLGPRPMIRLKSVVGGPLRPANTKALEQYDDAMEAFQSPAATSWKPGQRNIYEGMGFPVTQRRSVATRSPADGQ